MRHFFFFSQNCANTENQNILSWTCHEPNEIGYAKLNIEINSGAAFTNLNTSSLVPGMTVRSLGLLEIWAW